MYHSKNFNNILLSINNIKNIKNKIKDKINEDDELNEEDEINNEPILTKNYFNFFEIKKYIIKNVPYIILNIVLEILLNIILKIILNKYNLNFNSFYDDIMTNII